MRGNATSGTAGRQVLKVLATTKLVPGRVEGCWQRELETGWEEKHMLATLVELVRAEAPDEVLDAIDAQQSVAADRRVLTLASSWPLTTEVLIEDNAHVPTNRQATACTRCREKAIKCVYGGSGADLAGGDDQGAGIVELTEGYYSWSYSVPSLVKMYSVFPLSLCVCDMCVVYVPPPTMHRIRVDHTNCTATTADTVMIVSTRLQN